MPDGVLSCAKVQGGLFGGKGGVHKVVVALCGMITEYLSDLAGVDALHGRRKGVWLGQVLTLLLSFPYKVSAPWMREWRLSPHETRD